MTKETYDRHHNEQYEYCGKHAKRWYEIWRVYGPTGPSQHLLAYGLNEAKKAILGFYDYDVTELDGTPVDPKYLR